MSTGRTSSPSRRRRGGRDGVTLSGAGALTDAGTSPASAGRSAPRRPATSHPPSARPAPSTTTTSVRPVRTIASSASRRVAPGGITGSPSDPGTGPVFTGALVAGLIASSVVSGLIDAAGAVLTSVLTLTAYADLRARIEPLSTATLAAEIGLTPATAADWTAA